MKDWKATKLSIGNKVIIKYNGATVNFGQCYDGMVGIIIEVLYNNFQIMLDEKSKRKIKEINHRTHNSWTVKPRIPYEYVYVYPQSHLELE